MKRIFTVVALLAFGANAFAGPKDIQQGKTKIIFEQTENEFVFKQYVQKGKKWKYANLITKAEYDPQATPVFGDVWQYQQIGDGWYVVYDYIQNFNNEELKYTVAASSLTDGSTITESFIGVNLKSYELFPAEYKIEGMSDYSMKENADDPVVEQLNAILKLNTNLYELSEADYYTDKAIKWWFENNTESAKIINVAALSSESSISQAFSAAKKTKGDKYQVAVVQVRGKQEIVSQKYGSDQYSLVWVEDIPQNKATDAYVRSTYFQDENTLCLIYYKGKTVIKRRINLSTHAHTVK